MCKRKPNIYKIMYQSLLSSLCIKKDSSKKKNKSLKFQAAQACPSLHLSKCHIVGNHMPRLKLEILTCDHLICTMDHPKFFVSDIQDGRGYHYTTKGSALKDYVRVRRGRGSGLTTGTRSINK